MTCADGVDRGHAVETPVGTMYMRHVGWGVLIDNQSNTLPASPDRPYLTVAGRQFTATVGVYPDGGIERQYVSKVGGRHDEAAPSFRDKIVKEARKAALQWIEDHPEHVATGEHYRASMDVYSAEADIARLEPEYTKAVKRLRDARKALAAAQRKLEEVTS